MLNPVDMLAGAGAEQYSEICRIVAADAGADALMPVGRSLSPSGVSSRGMQGAKETVEPPRDRLVRAVEDSATPRDRLYYEGTIR